MNRVPVIEAENLSIGYRDGSKARQELYDSLTFSLYRGELTCLLGTNGAGKSTLLRTLGASQPALSGTLFLERRSLYDYSATEISRRIGLVLTDRSLAGGLRVRELVALGRYPYTGFFGRLNRSDEKIVDCSLDRVGIKHKASDYFSELSDGERQKVMIAKALAQECPVVLLDEPTAFLDVPSRIEIISLLRELATAEKKTILFSTHDMEQALLLSDRLWLLSRQNGLQCGVTEDMVLSGAVGDLFSHSSVNFDVSTGSFFPRYVLNKRAAISVPDNMAFWVRNCLMRAGYECLPAGAPDADISLLFVSPEKIRLMYKGGEELSLSSFAALKTALGDLSV